MKKIVFCLIAMAIGIALPLAIAEIGLRFLPVSTGLLAQPVNDANPIFRFLPNNNYVWSNRWNFPIVNHGRVNGAGFVNDREYEPGETSPLLAVIGDSYVEATMVPYSETLHGRLAAALEDRGRVYSFAASGAPLSQYLVWARHAAEVYGPSAMVFVVVGNDFDESLLAYKQGPGFHHYDEEGEGKLTLVRVDYEPNPYRSIVQLSALARYLVFNLQALETLPRVSGEIQRFWTGLMSFMSGGGGNGAVDATVLSTGGGEDDRYVGNVPRRVGADRLASSKRAVDAFFRDLPGMSGLAPKSILFVVDGVRYPTDYDLSAYFVQMRRYFLERAESLGYGTIDMERHFVREHQANGTRFEFPTDGHWNGSAHALAAQAIAETDLFVDKFGMRQAGNP